MTHSFRTAVVAAVAAATALTVVTAAQSASATAERRTAATSAPLYKASVVSAAAYAAKHGLSAGIAVLDTVTGTIYSAGNDHRRFATASVVKTMIATRLILTGQLHGRNKKLAWSMITRSDNAAAWTLYPKVGKDRLLPWLERHYHLAHVGAAPTMPGIWGSTQVTARGLVRFYNAVRHDPAVWRWLGAAMRAYQQRSTGNEPNAFGIATVAPHSAVKNGWDTHRDARHPSNAIINSTGFVDNGRYAVAILSEGPGSLYYRAGERIVTRTAGVLLRRAAPKISTAAATTHTTHWRATVVLDPGHNGGNGAPPAAVNKPVYAGYGRYKPCNTTGTATNSGYPEHAFTWDVANRVKKILLAHHVRVLMTRSNDHGVGPCVNRRAAIESTDGVSASVAIHADGAPSSGHGFHLSIDNKRPEHTSLKTVARTKKLNAALRKALARKSGLTVSTYLGHDGYYYRHDLAGLNLSRRPTAFLELGNMRNAGDAAKQRAASGRARIANAVATGILAYLFQ